MLRKMQQSFLYTYLLLDSAKLQACVFVETPVPWKGLQFFSLVETVAGSSLCSGLNRMEVYLA